jgi:hypothetical protein
MTLSALPHFPVASPPFFFSASTRDQTAARDRLRAPRGDDGAAALAHGARDDALGAWCRDESVVVVHELVSPTSLVAPVPARWRIVNYNGQTIQESYTGFPTIAAAVAEGNKRLRDHADRDARIVRRAWRRGR